MDNRDDWINTDAAALNVQDTDGDSEVPGVYAVQWTYKCSRMPCMPKS